MDFLKTTDGYTVFIKILSVNRHRAFPVLPVKIKTLTMVDGEEKKSEENVYDDRLYPKRTFIVNEITLEDLIKYHEITFTIISGHYYNSGFNIRLPQAMLLLFNERLKAKEKDPKGPLQAMIKLMMNSVYGKTIMKEIDTNHVFIHGEQKAKEHANYNFHLLDGYFPIGPKGKNYIVKLKNGMSEHTALPHVGGRILSMSKRIMHEVMFLAEDNGIFISYMDTDSMHIMQQDIPRLKNIFAQTYGRELIGKQLGQFHSDFEKPENSDIEPYAINSLFLAKKIYVDQVVYNSGGDSFNHIRMKGVPEFSIINNTNELKSVHDIYQNIYNGGSETFNLITKEHVRFVKNKNFTISNLDQFERTIKIQVKIIQNILKINNNNNNKFLFLFLFFLLLSFFFIMSS